jgi:hypothetical protein
MMMTIIINVGLRFDRRLLCSGMAANTVLGSFARPFNEETLAAPILH